MAIALVPDSGAAEKAPRRGQRPKLRVVAVGRPRWIAIAGSLVLLLVLAALLGAAVFHTQLAQRQLEIDELEQLVSDERVRFDELRRDRAVLRSPQRISDEATVLGMVPSESVQFIEIDPMELAKQLAAAGITDDDTARVIVDVGPLEQFRDVKAVSEGQP